MPTLRVTKNGLPVCTVGSGDVWMFSASVHADVWGPERSALTVTGGGKRRPDGTADFLIWQMHHELQPGDQLLFAFEEGTASSPKGELFVDEEDSDTPRNDFVSPLPEDEVVHMEARPKLNATCRWQFKCDEIELTASIEEVRQNLSLHLLWNEMRPHRMRVSLTQNSLREIVSRSGGAQLHLSYVEVGASVAVHVET